MQLVTEDNITELAARRWSSAHDPRTAELMSALVRHLHAFAREVRLSETEWMAAMRWLTETGQISDEKREEFILASDVLGLSMLVVQMNHAFDAKATPATVLGPFHIDGSPEKEFGGDMSDGLPGAPLYITGTVTGLDGSPSAARSSTSGRPTRKARTSRRSPASTRPGCARSTPPAPTGRTACARSRRRGTRSRWTARSAS